NGTAVAITTHANGFPGSHVSAVVCDDRDSVWAGTSVGIVRVKRSEFDLVASSRSHLIDYMLLDDADGVPGTPVYLGGLSAARGAEERLWFITSGGATIVDPGSLPEAGLPL